MPGFVAVFARSVMYSYIHSFPRSACALPVTKNPALKPFRNLRPRKAQAACILAVFLLCSQLVCRPVRLGRTVSCDMCKCDTSKMYPLKVDPLKTSKTISRLLKSKRTVQARFIEIRNQQISLINRLAAIPGLVEPDGIEPTTSCVQSRRSPS